MEQADGVSHLAADRSDTPGAMVRRIRPDEGALLRGLRLRALADAPEAFGQGLEDAKAQPDAEWAQAARQGSRGESRAWLIAEADTPSGAGRGPVGLILGRRRPPDTLMIFSMWVDPAARRRGIGRLLVDEVMRWGRSWGASRAVLWVFAANEPAIRFYERLDFAVELEGDDVASGHAYGALAMSRPIDVAED
jgi:GNAT superfamily N-acetyltransferase